MDRLTVSNIQAKLNNGNRILEIEDGSYLKYPNGVIQIVTNRTDERVSYSASGSSDGTTIDALSTSITPVFADSLLLITMMLNFEATHNNVILMHRDGQLITDAGFEPYNTEVGNVADSGLFAPYYDSNQASTPTNYFLQFAVLANDTSSRSYAPAFRPSSSSDTRTLYLNRTFNNSGGSSNETGISNINIMEIAQ